MRAHGEYNYFDGRRYGRPDMDMQGKFIIMPPSIGQGFSQLYEGPLVRGLVLGLGSSKVIQTAKKLTSPKVFREVLA